MTEKRFTVNYQNSEIVSVHDNGKTINIEQMVECLNTLHEENQQVRDVLNELKTIDSFWDSALLLGVICSIGIVLGVDME